MWPKSLRRRPPSLAIAPTIWRGSTLCRLPTAIRYVAIGTPSLRGRAAAGRGRRARRRALAVVALDARGRSGSFGSSSSGSSPCSTTASAAATSDLGHVVLADVVGDDVAEERRPRSVGERLGDRVVEPGQPGDVDVLDGRQLHLGQRLAGGLLDGLEQVALARGDERDRVAAAAGPAGAADAVHVGLGVGGDVVVDDVADPLDVEAAGGDVGGDEDVELAGLELVDGPLALRLRHVAVDRGGGEAAGPQLLGQRLGLVLGADEDDHPLEVLDLEDPGERVDLLRVGHHQVALGDVRRGRRSCS